ncbi:MAG: hypothetical protein LBG88_02525 [Christensenellaceae bacterium]|jgi:hypothetical protein|nr:hypothetical protein [Christensenellaceae bacterium]
MKMKKYFALMLSICMVALFSFIGQGSTFRMPALNVTSVVAMEQRDERVYDSISIDDDKKFYSSATIDDDFMDDSILVTLMEKVSLTQEKSQNIKRYTPTDFSGLRLANVTEITEELISKAEQRNKNETRFSKNFHRSIAARD